MPTNHDETLQDRYARELAAMEPKTPMVKVMAMNWQEDSLAPTWQQLLKAVGEHEALERRVAELESQLSAAPAAQPMTEQEILDAFESSPDVDDDDAPLFVFQAGVRYAEKLQASAPAAQPLQSIHEWHRRACPSPDARALDVQMGCHFEEVTELVESLAFRACGASMALDGEATELWRQLKLTAERLKSGEMSVSITDRRGALDGLGDSIVTAVGVGYRARMAIVEATERIDTSNWSKYVDGQPLYDGNGKVIKGPAYQAPDLTGLFELEDVK